MTMAIRKVDFIHMSAYSERMDLGVLIEHIYPTSCIVTSNFMIKFLS